MLLFVFFLSLLASSAYLCTAQRMIECNDWELNGNMFKDVFRVNFLNFFQTFLDLDRCRRTGTAGSAFFVTIVFEYFKVLLKQCRPFLT